MPVRMPGQAVVDVRFAHAVEVPGARRPAAARPARPAGASRRGITSSREHLLHLARHAGQEERLGRAQRHHEAGRDPGRVGQRPRPVRDAHLTQVVGRHLEAVRREPLLHRLQRRLVGRRAGREQLGHDVDGAVVFGRAQAAGRDDDVHLGAQPHQGACESPADRRTPPAARPARSRASNSRSARNAAFVLLTSPRSTSSPMASSAARCDLTARGLDI